MPDTESLTGCTALDALLQRGCPMCGAPLQYSIAGQLNGPPLHHIVCETGREGWFGDSAEQMALQLNTDALLYGGACQNETE